MAKIKSKTQDTMNLLMEDIEPASRQRPSLSPLQWEQLAKWVEARALKAELRAVQARDLIRQGVGMEPLLGQIGYWEATVAVSRKLAYDMRIGNNGPLNIKTEHEPNLD